MIKNQEYKNAALAALKGHWTPAVIATIVYILIALAISGPSSFMQPDTQAMLDNPGNPMAAFSGLWPVMCWSSLASLLLLMPIEIGFYYAFLLLFRNGDDRLTGNTFRHAFVPKYGRNILAMFLMGILVVIGCIFFLIPGIILALCYALLPYVLKDNPELSAIQALKKTRQMMKGHKFDYFWLCLSFIGWIILGIFTLGIGYIWLVPYIQTTVAVFYEDVKNGTAGLPGDVPYVAAEKVE